MDTSGSLYVELWSLMMEASSVLASQVWTPAVSLAALFCLHLRLYPYDARSYYFSGSSTWSCCRDAWQCIEVAFLLLCIGWPGADNTMLDRSMDNQRVKVSPIKLFLWENLRLSNDLFTCNGMEKGLIMKPQDAPWTALLRFGIKGFWIFLSRYPKGSALYHSQILHSNRQNNNSMLQVDKQHQNFRFNLMPITFITWSVTNIWLSHLYRPKNRQTNKKTGLSLTFEVQARKLRIKLVTLELIK